MSLYNPITVAIADDHPMFRKGMADLLSSYPEFKIVCLAGNGQELMQKISGHADCPDICILDIRMPVMDGYQTTTALSALYPDTKLIALSMFCTEVNILRMIRCGANGFLPKTAEPETIRHALNKVYYDGYYYHEELEGRLYNLKRKISGRNAYDPSEKELQFLAYCCSDLTYKEIANLMQLSVKTVDCYRDHLFQKFQVASRVGLVMYAIKSGLVNLE